MCGCASLVHAINAIRVHETATCYMRNLNELQLLPNSLAGMAEVLRQMKSQVPVRLYAPVEMQILKKMNASDLKNSRKMVL